MDLFGMFNPLRLEVFVFGLLTHHEYMGAPIPINTNHTHSTTTKGDFQSRRT